MFPTPELVYTDIYMVGVPYFWGELLTVQASMLCRQKKLRDPNSTISLVRNTPSTLPPDAPLLAPLDANTYAAGTIASAPSNPSGGLSGAHLFVVVALLSHFVFDTTSNCSHINSNN